VDWSILAGPISVGLVSSILSLVIAIVDLIVNNYGEISIDINAGKKSLKAKGGSSLLSTLAEKKIFLPSACGGKGTCGVCKCKITSDIGPHLPTEIPLLTKEEIKEGIHLSCQVKVKKNISIDIPEDLFAIQQFRTEVDSIVDLTHDIKEVYVTLVDPKEISFKAGQYAQIIAPPYAKVKDETQRAYSMLSAPKDSHRLGFLIRLVPGGIVTTYVHTELKQGDPLDMIAPVGEFSYHEADSIMLFIAGGSGMAPINSLIEDIVDKGFTHREAWYFFGARNLKELFYVEKFREIEKKWDKFKFIPALSEPLPEDKWEGDAGLITDVLDKYLKTKIDPTRQKSGYLCGSAGMIDACIRVLKAHNVTDDRIYYDKF
jgi:Na+-transporting NADH:ubiquinone oxidoreductase subunit F